ncbi:unnamed protein product [Medioppia subpectinata]|uniref:Splicing factor Cactin n=1 Tax=Medioppia subpectinata TaxID=1979941 RepID=A0A7R9KN45_9ACAR|nr:unnamed protein product [Medioppia subpectinata]CAG2105471.1 unnamed protein product [Medioppia subpectinata]
MSSSKSGHNDRPDGRHGSDSRHTSDRRVRDDRTRDDQHYRRRHESDRRRDDKRDDRRDERKESRDRDDSRRRRDRKTRKSSSKERRDRRRRGRSESSSGSGGSRGRGGGSSSSSKGSSNGESDDRMALITHRLAANQMEVLAEKERIRQKYKDDKNRQKEILKALETPEEKRMRRLAKKQGKERKRKLDSGWDEEYMGYTNADNPFGDANLHKTDQSFDYMGYTNADNPFGDANLHKTFIWGKKYDKMGLKNVAEEEINRLNRKKMESNKRELEKVKQRRIENEKEKEMRAEEATRQQREREVELFEEWEKQEDVFHLKQAKLRSKIRMTEGRAKPIDLLARYISAFGADIPVDDEAEKSEEMAADLVEPYICLNGLRITDLEDLFEDIKVYMTLDSEKNLEFWKDMQIIVEDELNKLKKFQSQNSVERREGINPAVAQEVVQVFKDKTPTQLHALQTQIEKKIHSNEEGVDIGYWESLLSKLKAHMARARLRELHDVNLNKRLNRLREEQMASKTTERVDGEPLFPIVDESSGVKTEDPVSSTTDVIDEQLQEDEAEEVDPMAKCVEDYESGQYSPKLLAMNDMESELILIEAIDDMKQLEDQRNSVLKKETTERAANSAMSVAEQAFEREARKGMSNEEAMFSVEEQIKHIEKQYSWSDKYRPRKPRYFNRVHTGFEWNKYNQTHYDVDNPPPKVVQGYKFNIFYPDLINKGQSPTFKITACPENRDFAFIRFSSGPPYEDICFKIVNREWNYSYKSGFRSQFHNNILQLWFHFKRYRYRR